MISNQFKKLLDLTYSEEVVEFVHSLDHVPRSNNRFVFQFSIGNLLVETNQVVDQLEFLIQTDGYWNMLVTGLFSLKTDIEQVVKVLLPIAFPLMQTPQNAKKLQSLVKNNTVELQNGLVLNNKTFIYELSVLSLSHVKRNTQHVLPCLNTKHLFLTNVIEIKH